MLGIIMSYLFNVLSSGSYFSSYTIDMTFHIRKWANPIIANMIEHKCAVLFVQRIIFVQGVLEIFFFLNGTANTFYTIRHYNSFDT